VRALRDLAMLLKRRHDSDHHLVELVLVLALVVIVTALSFVFLGDAVADLISLIGGHVDEVVLSD
jgi:hypothetical protein